MSKGEATRRRIIEAAAPLFNMRGFAGCSMQDVVEATGLEKGGLYRHFSSKDELAVAAFRHSFAQVMAARRGVESVSRGAIETLLQHVRRFIEVPSPIQGGCPLMNTAVDADDTHPELRQLACEAIGVWKRELSQILEEGVRSGEISKSVQPVRIANVIVAALEGGLMISRLEGNSSAMLDVQATLEEWIQTLGTVQKKSTQSPDQTVEERRS